MRHPRPGRGDRRHVRVVEVDAVREPDVVPGPAQVLHELEWTLSEFLQAETLFVQRFRDVRVQPYAVAARERGRVAHQLGGHRERRARRHHDAAHRAGRRVVEVMDLLLRVREDRVLVFDHAVGRQAALRFAE